MAMGLITPKIVAEKLAAHLQHELPLDSLVAWAESALMDAEFDPAYLPTIRDVVPRIGVADVRVFDPTWNDCGTPWQTAVPPGGFSATPRRSLSSAEAGEQLLTQLGYSAQVSIVARWFHKALQHAEVDLVPFNYHDLHARAESMEKPGCVIQQKCRSKGLAFHRYMELFRSV